MESSVYILLYKAKRCCFETIQNFAREYQQKSNIPSNINEENDV